MKHFIKILFFLSWVCTMSIDAVDTTIDQDFVINEVTIKGRLNDPTLRKDYRYLQYLSDSLFFMKRRYEHKMSAAQLTLMGQNIVQRIGTLMVGGGSGLQKRALEKINPDVRWQAINNLALIVQADQQYALSIDFSTFFDNLSKKVRITKNGVNDDDYQKHLNILKGMIVAESKAIHLPMTKNDEEAKERLDFCTTEAAKGLDENTKERVHLYLKEFGIGQGLRQWKRQIERVKNFYTYRQSLGLPVRMALGVSNDAQYLEERQRFSDDSWIVWDHEEIINPGGPIGLAGDFETDEALDGLINQNIVSDDISIDDAVLHLTHPNMMFPHKMSQMIKKGATFHFTLGFGYDLVSKNGLGYKDIDLEQSTEKIADDIATKLNFFVYEGKFWPSDFNPRLRMPDEFLKYRNNDAGPEKNQQFKDVKKMIDEKYYLAYYRAMLADPKKKPRNWFEKIELKAAKDHPLKIYRLPDVPMIVATK